MIGISIFDVAFRTSIKYLHVVLTSRAHLPPTAAAIPCKANTILSGKVASAIDLVVSHTKGRYYYYVNTKINRTRFTQD